MYSVQKGYRYSCYKAYGCRFHLQMFKQSQSANKNIDETHKYQFPPAWEIRKAADEYKKESKEGSLSLNAACVIKHQALKQGPKPHLLPRYLWYLRSLHWGNWQAV